MTLTTEGQGQWQNWTKHAIAKKLLDLSADAMHMALFRGAIPDVDGTIVLADLTQIVASGYTADGVAISGQSETQVDASDLAKFTADPVVWAALGAPSTGALTYAAIYVDATIGALVKPILFVYKTDKVPNGSSLTVNPSAAGYATLT